MFITAAWALEQEYKAYKWLTHGTSGKGRSWTDLSPAEQLAFGTVATGWGAAHVAMGMMPYSQMGNVRGKLLDYQVSSKLAARSPSGFSIKGGKITPKWVRPSTAARFGAKIGARAIPYVGWALLAADLYYTGKWIQSKF